MEQAVKNSPFCVIDKLNVTFNERPVLRDIDLTLNKRGATVIVGPSGSGKTTLLRALNRLNEQCSGYRGDGRINLRLDGELQDIQQEAIDVTQLRRQVGMVFQTPNVLPNSIGANILLPLKLVTSLNAHDREERMRAALCQVHLWDEVKDRLKENAARLSGGQQQRLCLARALALQPQILLLDEPTSSLDFKTADRIEGLILELKPSYPIIAVSHSLQQARKIADHIVVMKAGKIVQQLGKDQFHCPETLQQLLEQVF